MQGIVGVAHAQFVDTRALLHFLSRCQSCCGVTSHTQRLTYRLRRKLAIRESQVIKWAWENVGAKGIYFGSEMEMEEESDDSCTGEEPGPPKQSGSTRLSGQDIDFQSASLAVTEAS